MLLLWYDIYPLLVYKEGETTHTGYDMWMEELGAGDSAVVLGEKIGTVTVEYVDDGGTKAIVTAATGEEYVLPVSVLQKVETK